MTTNGAMPAANADAVTAQLILPERLHPQRWEQGKGEFLTLAFNQKQQKLLQVWQVSGKHKNASNDCKSVNDLCNQLQGTQPWCVLATARGMWGQLAQRGFHPPVPQASQPQHESGIIQLCQQVARMTRAQPGHALQRLPCREDFGFVY